MVLVEIDTVVVHTTSVTATTGVLTVLAYDMLVLKLSWTGGGKTRTDTAMAMADMSAEFPGLLPVSRLEKKH